MGFKKWKCGILNSTPPLLLLIPKTKMPEKEKHDPFVNIDNIWMSSCV